MGDVHTAASTSKAAVEAAISAASDGDTVIVPDGADAWASKIEVSKELLIKGAGIGNTVISDYAFVFLDSVNNWRVTGFTFDGNQNNYVFGVGTAEGAGCKNFRIDNCKVMDTGTALRVRGYSYGLMDNCLWEDCGGEAMHVIAEGPAAWERQLTPGKYTNGTFFVENCIFRLTNKNSLNVIDSNGGSRYVMRYNLFEDHANYKWNYPMEVHGWCNNPGISTPRGNCCVEIYENTFISNNNEWKRGANIRGGTGVFYNNTFIGYWALNLYFDNVRSDESNCSGCGAASPSCSPLGDYPAQDQVFDFYIWGNTDDGGPISVAVNGNTHVPQNIQENRDYFLIEKSGYSPYPYPHPLRTDYRSDMIIKML